MTLAVAAAALRVLRVPGLLPYAAGLALQERTCAAVAAGTAPHTLLLVEVRRRDFLANPRHAAPALARLHGRQALHHAQPVGRSRGALAALRACLRR